MNAFLDDFKFYSKTSLSHQAPRLKSIPHAEELAEAMLKVSIVWDHSISAYAKKFRKTNYTHAHVCVSGGKNC